MKRLFIGLVLAAASLSGCSTSSNRVTVCASEIPHAEILNECVKPLMEAKGYKLEVTVLDWTMQNDAVRNNEYDANYFEHMPYLNTYEHVSDLKMTAKVHYEPLGIYKGGASTNTVEICNDTSNALRAFDLLKANGYLTTEGYRNGDELSFTGSTYTENGYIVTLISEELLVASMQDYGLACLPCNTAMTGNVTAAPLKTESDPELVTSKANGLVCNKAKYESDTSYKEKIDILTDILLSKEVSDWVKTKYNQKITCDSSSQIDLR